MDSISADGDDSRRMPSKSGDHFSGRAPAKTGLTKVHTRSELRGR
jgi:hypothetical protein